MNGDLDETGSPKINFFDVVALLDHLQLDDSEEIPISECRQQAGNINYDNNVNIIDVVKGITKKTRVIFLSHITSPTGLIFPIEEICQIAREKKIITIVKKLKNVSKNNYEKQLLCFIFVRNGDATIKIT